MRNFSAIKMLSFSGFIVYHFGGILCGGFIGNLVKYFAEIRGVVITYTNSNITKQDIGVLMDHCHSCFHTAFGQVGTERRFRILS